MTNINRRIDLRQRGGAGAGRALWYKQTITAMRCFAIPIYECILRYYLMMAVVIIAGFSGLYLLALLALPIFLSAILGISFKSAPAKQAATVAMPAAARRVELTAWEAATADIAA